MKLTDLVKSIGVYSIYSPGGEAVPEPFADFDVTALSCNSRENLRDAVFVAVKGAQADGHAFIQDAIRRGARVVIFEDVRRVVSNKSEDPFALRPVFIQVPDSRKALVALAQSFYGYPSKTLPVIGITGTNGKTTISYLVEAIIKQAGKNPAVIGTVNYRFNGSVMPSINTTPGPVELQHMLRSMVDAGVTHLAMEVSSHALDQDRVAGIKFSGAIFTNLTQDHLDYHKGFEEYFQAKAKLFLNLADEAAAVVNRDDAYGARLAAMSKGKIVTYGLDEKADVYACNIRMDIDHTYFTLCAFGKKFDLSISLIGRHNVYNVLGAAAWALVSGISPEDLTAALKSFTAVPGRLERIDIVSGVKVFVDYAHTQDALLNVISTLRQITSNKIIVVFGCGGDRDKTKRPEMGRVVTELADFAVITSDNPRSEDPQAIIDDILKGITKKNFNVVIDRMSAIRSGLSQAKPGDVVLVAGKGHETYQIIKDSVLHFDDREAVRECSISLN